ncbi:hypothetical protein RHSIM_Rhsim10G0065700 [Rhododendron simsii]|uniref:DUF4283 domain-containing protein n=1 Tax=Rhododendron simsii TaxID=118357 RepID=A0A834GE79_RHOSS|nr:hypothetical protein RHSIM_Rhsim10G0065700 [Rhododendron simsii]
MGVVLKGEVPSVVWVRILGLPQHLWDSEVFREIRDFCGGFVRVDDRMRRRDNLRWARIAVRAAPEMVPAKVKVMMGGWVFDLPLWVERGPIVVFQPALNVDKGGGGVVTSGCGGCELVVHSLEKTRGGISQRARGGWGEGSYGDTGSPGIVDEGASGKDLTKKMGEGGAMGNRVMLLVGRMDIRTVLFFK